MAELANKPIFTCSPPGSSLQMTDLKYKAIFVEFQSNASLNVSSPKRFNIGPDSKTQNSKRHHTSHRTAFVKRNRRLKDKAIGAAIAYLPRVLIAGPLAFTITQPWVNIGQMAQQTRDAPREESLRNSSSLSLAYKVFPICAGRRHGFRMNLSS